MQFRLENPGYHCRQCSENMEAGADPPCRGGECPIPRICWGNQVAYEIYEACNSQFVYDFHLADSIIAACATELSYTLDDYLQLCARLTAIHEVIKTHGKESG